MRRIAFCSALLACLFILNLSAQRICTSGCLTCGQTFTAAGGNWTGNSGWNPNAPPGTGINDCVIIPAGVTVTYDVTNPPPHPIVQLLINGTLNFKTNGQSTDTYLLKAYLIGVNDSGTAGTLQIGSAAAPFPSNAVISLFGMARSCYLTNTDDYQACNAGLQVAAGGTWTTQISNTNLNYQAPLAVDTQQTGPNTIKVTGNLTGSWFYNASNPNNSDLLVITSTDYVQGSCPTCSNDTSCVQDHNELLQINGTLTFDGTNTTVPVVRLSPPGSGMRFRHKSTGNSYPDNIPSQVGKLNRNIRIQADSMSVDGSSQLLPSFTLVSPTAANVQIQDVEFYNLGVSDSLQLFPNNKLNLYAVHMHNTNDGTTIYPRSVLKSSFHNDYLCAASGAGCSPLSPVGGFGSQLVLHRVRSTTTITTTIDKNVFYNPVPFVVDGAGNGGSLYGTVPPGTSDVDAGIYTDSLTITNNLVVTDPTNTCIYGLGCKADNTCWTNLDGSFPCATGTCSCSPPGSCKPFPSALYVQSARHTINNNFVNGGYYGYYGVISPPVNPDTLNGRCNTQSLPPPQGTCTNPPCVTECDMASFQNNIAVASFNDNFFYKGLFTKTPPNNTINTIRNFQSYIGQDGIQYMDLSPNAPAGAPLPKITQFTNQGGFVITASRGGLPMDSSVGVNFIYGKPYNPLSPTAAKSAVQINRWPTNQQPIDGLAIYNDYNNTGTDAALEVFNFDPAQIVPPNCTQTQYVRQMIEKLNDVSFIPDTDPSGSNNNRVMVFKCKEDTPPSGGRSCIQLCNFWMPSTSTFFAALAAAAGNQTGPYINFVARPKVTSMDDNCAATYGAGFKQAPPGFATRGLDGVSYSDICVANVTAQTCPNVTSCPAPPPSQPLIRR